ncbi:fluoride efflux transporter FluC [Luteococcus sp.]|uniref:fluoride efflux transporter FluC n=1 Tax=Luteococcus sp. TaxID=1969402 RepID=UPI003735F44C
METAVQARSSQPSAVLLVAVGGVLGTLARWGLSQLVPAHGGWPLPTLLVNLVGAFCLGLLLESLLRAGQDVGRRRSARLLLGTGLLGSFTTMSSLATELVLLAKQPLVAVGYGVTSLVGGLLMAWGGIVLAARRRS